MVLVRYIVNDVDAAIAFYTQQLGFHLDMHPAPLITMLSRAELRLILSMPMHAAGVVGLYRMVGTRRQEAGTGSLLKSAT